MTEGLVETVSKDAVARVTEVAEMIRSRCAHAQQLKLTGQQVTTAGSVQVAQAEEMQKKLLEVILRLEEEVRDPTLAGMQQRLEHMSKKLRLKFDLQPSQSQVLLFLSSKGFFVEVSCTPLGTVGGVTLTLGRSQPSDCPVLLELLQRKQFREFERHLGALEELDAQAGVSDKVHVYKVLAALESILLSISESSPQAAKQDVILLNPLGQVTPRSGGLPMQLTFFLNPGDVIGSSTTATAVAGVYGKVILEKASKMCLLPIDPNLFNPSKANFYPLSEQNSVQLAATLLLELSQPVPVCRPILNHLHQVDPSPAPHHTPSDGGSFDELVAKQMRGVVLSSDGGTQVVHLPGQCHYYSFSKLGAAEVGGVLVYKVPFTHPCHLFTVIQSLRRQLIYNSLVASCLGGGGGARAPNDGSMLDVQEYLLEVKTVPAEAIEVALDSVFQSEQERLTVRFLIPEVQPTLPTVEVCVGLADESTHSLQLSKVLQKCMSVPVTLWRAIKLLSKCNALGAKLSADIFH